MQLQNTFLPFIQKLSKLPHAKIAMFVGVILLGYTAYLFAQITWLITDTSQKNQNVQLNNIGVKSTKNNANINIDSIRSLNLFGNYSEVPVINNEPEEIEDAPETSLNLVLTGVVASNDLNKSAAIIEYNNMQEIYAMDETINGTRAVLKKVFTDRVHIRHSGRLETLMLDGFDYEENQVLTKPRESSTNKNLSRSASTDKRSLSTSNMSKLDKAPKRIDQRSNEEFSQQAQAFIEDIDENPGKITDYLQIAPKRVEGEIIGYRLMPGKKPDFFKAAGLKSGDVAIQMNGLDLSQPSEAAQALKALREERDVSLLVNRDGDITEILFSIDQ